MEKKRCSWVEGAPEIYVKYHDFEWGEEVHDDRTLFEFLILEGAQAGLSWLTVLRKRENYRRAFDSFDFEKVAKYDEAPLGVPQKPGTKGAKIEELMNNEGIIRNRLKVNSAVRNAKVFIKIRSEFGSFDKYLWGFVDFKPIVNSWDSIKDLPVTTPESDALSEDLKKRGMNFVGSTIIYAYMQTVGLVQDHERKCFKASL